MQTYLNVNARHSPSFMDLNSPYRTKQANTYSKLVSILKVQNAIRNYDQRQWVLAVIVDINNYGHDVRASSTGPFISKTFYKLDRRYTISNVKW